MEMEKARMAAYYCNRLDELEVLNEQLAMYDTDKMSLTLTVEREKDTVRIKLPHVAVDALGLGALDMPEDIKKQIEEL